MNRPIRALSVFASVAAAFLAGCASTPAEATGDSMNSAGKRLDGAITQVDAVVDAMNALVTGKSGDLKGPFKKYTEQVAKTESAAANARKAADDMRAKATEQFEQWAKEAQNISDADLKKANIARRDEARAAFAKVQDSRDKAKAAYGPFVSGLKDIQTVLTSDLTARGVESASPKISEVQNSAEKLKVAIRDVQKAIGEFRAQVASQAAPAAK